MSGRPLRRLFALPALLAGLLALPAAAKAQGLTPRWEPTGLDFRSVGVWRTRARRIAAARAAALSRGDERSLNAALRGAASFSSGIPTSNMAITGTLTVPVILFRFKDTDSTLSRPASAYVATLFGTTPPNGNPYSVRTFYEEMSNGLFSMQGDVVGWVTLDNNMASYTGPASGCPSPVGTCNGIWNQAAISAMQSGLVEALTKADGSVDFGQFDNDGPDGIPNSGDDDGVVDMAVFVQPAKDGACVTNGNNDLWSHRYVLQNAYETDDAVHGDPSSHIFVFDYTLQAGVGGASACDETQMMAIGTIAHETGHGLGLPDLYDTNPNDQDDSEGIGNWGLMSSGNYSRPMSPAYMEGFSRLQLGWVTVRDISTAGTYTVGPYTVADTILRIVPPGPNARGEYFLIENRQGTMSDSALINQKGPGLLIWHVDSLKYANGLFSNSVNSGSIHGLALMQADGLNQLGSSTPNVKNRGDAGDPFPGTSNNTTFTSTTNPSSRLDDNTIPPFTIDSIRQVVPNGAMSFRFRPDLGPLAVSDTALRVAVMGAVYLDTLKMGGGTGSYTMTILTGTLPPGLSLSSAGIIAGTPQKDSTYTFTVRAQSGASTLDLPMQVAVSAPALVLNNVLDQLLSGGSHLTGAERNYLDLLGNKNNQLDVGDFAAWLDHTGQTVSADMMRRLAAGARR